MESRFRILFLIAALASGGCAASPFGLGRAEAPPGAGLSDQVIDPEVERREIKEAKIDSENFELGAFAGILSIEDFGANAVYGARLAFHVTEGFFVEATAGMSEAGLTSFEIPSGAARLINDAERRLTYYNLNLGYNILPGEAFLGEGRTHNTNLYLIAGLGSTRFAGLERFTVNYGAGFRFLLSDTLAIHIDFRDHLFNIDLLGRQKTVHNLEGHLGLTVFF